MRKAQELIAGKIREWFSLDYRSLAVLRIGIGITILADLVQRAGDLRAFYTDSGVLSRSELLRIWQPLWDTSLHMASGMAGFEITLFVIAALLAIMLITGYRTRTAIILSWFLLISIQFRNPMVLQGGDIVLRVVTFWMMFLPLSKTWSLDRYLNRTRESIRKVTTSPATIAYIVQICLIYFMSGILKTGAPWHDGTAVYYALNVDQLITPFAAFIREFPGFMKLLTHGVWYLEVFGIALFFSPWKTAFFRMGGIIAFALLQIGFNSGMRLGLFGMISVVITLGLLPSALWDDWLPRITSSSIKKLGQDIQVWFEKKLSAFEKESPRTLTLPRSWNIIGNVCIIGMMIYVVAWNIDTTNSRRKILPPESEWLGYMTHMDQVFNMFAPMPLTEDGWYVIPGILRDGGTVDARTGNPVSYEKPTWVSYTYKNQRWQKYMMNLWSRDNSEYRLGYGQYLCRQWNNNHPYEKQLMNFDIIFMLEKTPPPGQTPDPVEPVTIWNHHCF